MLPEVRNYLDEVRSHLHLDSPTEKRVISELYSYFQERVAELQEKGISERDATREAIKSFGRAQVVSRLTYEAYSRGGWTEVAITSLPHLTLAALFASHLWRHPLYALITLASIVGITLFGWRYGKPNWLYSWIGYSLLPLLIIGYTAWSTLQQTVPLFLRGDGTLSSALSLLLVIALYLLSLWIIVSITIQVVKRDWILASLILVPLPILGSWLFNIEQVGGLFQGTGAALHQWDAPMASVLTVLGVTAAIFIRLRQRVLKAGALVTVGVIAGAIIAHNLWGDIGLLGLLTTSLLLLLFLLSPALLESKIGHGEPKGEAWWSGDWIERPSTTR